MNRALVFFAAILTTMSCLMFLTEVSRLFMANRVTSHLPSLGSGMVFKKDESNHDYNEVVATSRVTYDLTPIKDAQDESSVANPPLEETV